MRQGRAHLGELLLGKHFDLASTGVCLLTVNSTWVTFQLQVCWEAYSRQDGTDKHVREQNVQELEELPDNTRRPGNNLYRPQHADCVPHGSLERRCRDFARHAQAGGQLGDHRRCEFGTSQNQPNTANSNRISSQTSKRSSPKPGHLQTASRISPWRKVQARSCLTSSSRPRRTSTLRSATLSTPPAPCKSSSASSAAQTST